MHIFEITVFGIQIAPTWYGFMYALGFIFCFLFFRKYSKYSLKELESLGVWIFVGVLFGGRIGYILLYNLPYFIDNPGEIFSVWKGGMSFHGGFIGVLIAVFLYQKMRKEKFFDMMDLLAICTPIALGLGRIGNYINGELLGFSPYDGPMKILQNNISYFPSTLLEMFLEGIVLFIVLYSLFLYKKMERIGSGFYSGVFLIGYGFARGISEFFRLPDMHIGYLFGTEYITLGMLYTLPFFLAGGIILFHARQKKISQ